MAASLPVTGVSGPVPGKGDDLASATWHARGDEWFRVDWPAAPTTEQQAAADAVVQISDLRPRCPRPLQDILASLNALTAAQTAAIWTDLTSGSPSRCERNGGPNAAATALLQTLASLSSLSAADLLSLKLRGMALYCQDNPGYLMQPSFDPTIQVAGDTVAS